MMPTKPISPDTETAAAVPSEAATIRTSRVRCGCRPRLAASSSPTDSTSSCRRWARTTTAVTTVYGSSSARRASRRSASRAEDPRVHLADGLHVALQQDRSARRSGSWPTATPPGSAWPASGCPVPGRTERVGQRDRDQGPAERERPVPRPACAVAPSPTWCRRRTADDHGRRRAETGPGRDPQQVRVGQRVAEHALVGSPRPGPASRRPAARAPPAAAGARRRWPVSTGRQSSCGHARPGMRSSTARGRAQRVEPDRAEGQPGQAATRTAPSPTASQPTRGSAGPVGAGRRRRSRSVTGALATASVIARTRSTTRGPQREAMSSSSATPRCLHRGDARPSRPRLATVSADCQQHLVSARKIRSGLALTITSADSCGYGLLAVPLGRVGDVRQPGHGEQRADERVFDVTE